MRHQGVDIGRIMDDSLAVGTDALKGVGWLTALDKEFTSRVGGVPKLRKALPRAVEIIDLPRGTVLQAGPRPETGDLNEGDKLPLYGAIFRLIAPFVEIAAARSPSFNLATDYVERTEGWFMRLNNG